MFTKRQIARGNTYLLRLADYVERRHRAKPRKGYDQRRVTHDCGAPACLLGHQIAAQHTGKLPSPAIGIFALDNDEWTAIFHTNGCNQARTDWRKAVEYVRRFVALRRQAGLHPSPLTPTPC